MKRNQAIYLMICIIIFISTAGCSTDGLDDIKSKGISPTTYAEEIGLSFITPIKEKFNAETTVVMEGVIEDEAALNQAELWVVITSKDAVDTEVFNYYVAIEDGTFMQEMVLTNGEGLYEVHVRAPSNKPDEADVYYDVGVFDVINQDEEVISDVEYTQYGVKHGTKLISPKAGSMQFDGNVLIDGTVPADHKGDMILVQVEKNSDTRQIILPIKDNKFTGEVPLYFGEGTHHIRIQTYNQAEDLYYESASFYAGNAVYKEFAEKEKYNEYITRGITLDEPASQQEAVYNQLDYKIVGEVDKTIPGADKINYIIVTVSNLDEDVEAGYLIPVNNYQFDGLVYFRFGPGNYEVVVNIPDLEQDDQSVFYYQGVAKINHQVIDIKDERSRLPSRGIESDHPTIMKQGEQIVAGLTNDRDKAKAIYEFVAKNVTYDVKKAEDNIFDIGDSALSTLAAGTGICQDYAFLATGLLRAIDMDARYIEGDAGERHAWVEVRVDGEWLVMDPTWGAGYVKDGVFHSRYNEDYFDPDPAFLAETHTREDVMY